MLYYRIARSDTIKREIKKMPHDIALFRMEDLLLGRSRSGVGVGVGVEIFRPESELESESLKIRRLRSPGDDITIRSKNIVAVDRGRRAKMTPL